MSLTLVSQLFNAFACLPGDVQIVIAGLIFILCIIVFVCNKACDNCVRVIAAIRGEQPPKK